VIRRSAQFGLLLAVLVAPARVAAADEALSPERQREILHDAIHAFDEAVAAMASDPPQARELYRRSIACFQTLVDHGVDNAAVQYNLGNAYYRLGDLGRAVLHYRRAQRWGGLDDKLGLNLAFVRGQVTPQVRADDSQRLRRNLLFWHYGTTLRQRYGTALLCSIVGWGVLLLTLRWRRATLRAVGMLAVAVGLVAGGSAAWQLHDDSRRPPAVVVGEPHILRLGRGDAYDAALDQPLGPGTELRVLTQRADWVEVVLLDGTTGWLRADRVERI